MRPNLNRFTLETIRSWSPCLDPATINGTKEGKKYTALDVLLHPHVSDADKLWLVLRPDVLDEKLLHRFAVWCAVDALFSTDIAPDSRSLNALEVKLRFIAGKATVEELSEAADSAWKAVAQGGQAGFMARSAASAAGDTAVSAAASAAWRAAKSAADEGATESGARKAQVEKLVAMIVHGEVEFYELMIKEGGF